MNLLEIYEKCSIRSECRSEAIWAAKVIMANQQRYQVPADRVPPDEFGMRLLPWVIGVIHCREASFNFGCHLSNGEPLNRVTTLVPAGIGPFTGADAWEQGAIAALQHEEWTSGRLHWDLGNAIDNIERYNGLGYRNMGVMSPYLAAGTDAYTSGKYVRDGFYDPNAVDQQLGCFAIMKALEGMGVELQSPK